MRSRSLGGGDTAESLTVRIAGGSQQVVPLKDIKSAGYIDGTSVMPDGLVDSLDDTRIAELVRHVQSLE